MTPNECNYRKVQSYEGFQRAKWYGNLCACQVLAAGLRDASRLSLFISLCKAFTTFCHSRQREEKFTISHALTTPRLWEIFLAFILGSSYFLRTNKRMTLGTKLFWKLLRLLAITVFALLYTIKVYFISITL